MMQYDGSHQSHKGVFRTCLAGFALSCAVIVILVMFREFQVATIHVQIDYEEGNILNAGVRITNGLTPYPIPQATPEALNPYGPIGYYLVALLVQNFGIGFVAPRMAVLVFGLACGSLVALVVQHFTKSRLLAVGAGMSYLLMHEPIIYLPLLRVDFIGLAFTLSGVYIYATRPKWIVLCAVLFAIAVFTKYSFLAAPAACFMDQLRQKQYRPAILFASALSIICLAAFAIMQAWTQSAFAFHMFQTHADSSSVYKWARSLYSSLRRSAPFSLIAFCYAVITLKEKIVPFPLIYFGVATLMTFTIAKAGSINNHLLEFLAALTICAALGIYTLKVRGYQSFAAVLLVFLAVWLPFRWPQKRLILEQQASKRGCFELYDYVSGAPAKNVLSENIGAVVLARKPVLLSNPFVYTQLVRANKWSDDDLVHKLATQQFDLVIRQEPWDESRWTARSIAVINENFRVVAHFDCHESQLVLLPD